MFVTTEQITVASKANIESALTIANSAFANVERLSALNINTARTMLEDAMTSAKALLSVKDAQEIYSLQSAFVQPLLEKAVAYNRSVYEIANQGQAEVAKLVEAQLAELNKTMNDALDQAAKSAPAGSDVAVAAVKSAIEAANSAYDSVNKAAKQVAEMAEANMTAATNATVKAVSSSTTKKAA